jgi:hypothetical protein
MPKIEEEVAVAISYQLRFGEGKLWERRLGGDQDLSRSHPESGKNPANPVDPVDPVGQSFALQF